MLAVMWFGHTGHSLPLSPTSISCEAFKNCAKEGRHPRAPANLGDGSTTRGDRLVQQYGQQDAQDPGHPNCVRAVWCVEVECETVLFEVSCFGGGVPIGWLQVCVI